MLVDEAVLKIADFGLAREIKVLDYHRKDSAGFLPVKWMALEPVFFHVYLNQSDFWSFGVLLWELVILGDSPYPEVVNIENLFHQLREELRMKQPHDCILQM